MLERLRIEPGEIAIGIGETLIRFDFLWKGRFKAEVRVIKAEHDRRICHCREREKDRRVTVYSVNEINENNSLLAYEVLCYILFAKMIIENFEEFRKPIFIFSLV